MASVLIKCKSTTRGRWLAVGGGSAVAGLTNQEERRGDGPGVDLRSGMSMGMAASVPAAEMMQSIPNKLFGGCFRWQYMLYVASAEGPLGHRGGPPAPGVKANAAHSIHKLRSTHNKAVLLFRHTLSYR